MPPKRIIVLCDGTSQDGAVKTEEKQSNIYRLSKVINETDKQMVQKVHYIPGPATDGNLVAKAWDVCFGSSVAQKISEAYEYIVDHFEREDEIFLFGFSRGAYIAMIVAQIIGKIGVLEKNDFSAEFKTIYENYTKLGEAKTADKSKWVKKLGPWTGADAPGKRRVEEFSVKCLGLFDTVGSTGTDPLRSVLPVIEANNTLGRSPHKTFSGSVREVGDHIEHTYQALAINERRPVFPCIRVIRSPSRAEVQTMKECWFIGDHSDIGGSHKEHELSDLTLTWMIGQIGEKLSVDLVHLYRLFQPKHEWGKQRSHSKYDWNRNIPNDPAGDESSAERRYHPSVLEINKIVDPTESEEDKKDREKLFEYVTNEITDNHKLLAKLSGVEEAVKAGWPNLMKGIYSITVTIDKKTLEGLKSRHLTLALVRNVNVDGQTRSGNIVLATKDLNLKQTFTWAEMYEVFATEVPFINDRLVDESETSHSKPRAIERGQTATIGSKEVSVNGRVDYTKPITVVNDWKDNAHLVIGCKNSEEVVTPFYIFPTTMASKYPYELTPAQSFFVFFDNDPQTKTMVDVEAKNVTGHFQFNDDAKHCTVSYKASGTDLTTYWKSEDGARKL